MHLPLIYGRNESWGSYTDEKKREACLCSVCFHSDCFPFSFRQWLSLSPLRSALLMEASTGKFL